MVSNKNGFSGHPGKEELEALHCGRLSLAETARLNAHKAECDACGEKYDRVALAHSGEKKTDEMITERFIRMMDAHSHHCAMDLSVDRVTPHFRRKTELEGIISSLSSADSSRFLITHGKLESLIKEIRGFIDKLEADPVLTPDGERNFVTFLALCAEANISDIAHEKDSVEQEKIIEMAKTLKDLLSGENIFMRHSGILSDIAREFDQKLSNIISEF